MLAVTWRVPGRPSCELGAALVEPADAVGALGHQVAVLLGQPGVGEQGAESGPVAPRPSARSTGPSRFRIASCARHPGRRSASTGRRSGPAAPALAGRDGGSLDSSVVSDFLRSYLTVAIFGAVAVGLVAGVLGLGSLIRPDAPAASKYLTYESGVDPVGDGLDPGQIRYYIFALLFVMFDVEAVFIFPWATRLEAYGVFGARRDGRSSSSCSPSACSTPGARGCSDGSGQAADGSRRERQDAQAAHHAAQPVPQVLPLGVPVGPGLLRHRDGRRLRLAPLRRDAPRRHPAAGLAPPGRPRGHLGHGHRQDGPGHPAALRADARPEVRDLDGLAAPTAAARTGTATR